MSIFQTSKSTQIKIFLLSIVLGLSYLGTLAPPASAAAGDSAQECRAANGTWQEKDRGGSGFECILAPSSKSPAQIQCSKDGGTWSQGAGAQFVCTGAKNGSVSAGGSLSSESTCGKQTSFLGFPTWHKYLKKDANCNIVDFCALTNTDENGVVNVETSDEGAEIPVCRNSSVPLVILAIIEILLRIGSIVAVAFVIVGGIKFVTSQGEPEGVKGARNTILNALIGLVITIFATPIVSFIAGRLG